MKDKNGLFNLFLDELKDMYSAENQLIEALPKLKKPHRYQILKMR